MPLSFLHGVQGIGMGKVFWGVLLALMTFSALAFVGRAAVLASIAAAADQEAQRIQQEQHARQVAQQRARSADLQRRRLAVNERCVSGTIIRVDGTSYTQVLEAGHVVPCSGLYRRH